MRIAFGCSESERAHYIDIVRVDDAAAEPLRLPFKYRAGLAAFDPAGIMNPGKVL